VHPNSNGNVGQLVDTHWRGDFARRFGVLDEAVSSRETGSSIRIESIDLGIKRPARHEIGQCWPLSSVHASGVLKDAGVPKLG
jgi:hypothetical protein